MHYEQCFPDFGSATGSNSDVEICKVCDDTTGTYWEKYVMFTVDPDTAVVTTTVLQDYTDTGRPCNAAQTCPAFLPIGLITDLNLLSA